jgi:hypothetical protein
MGKQVVAFQAAMKLMSESFPGAFKAGMYELHSARERIFSSLGLYSENLISYFSLNATCTATARGISSP